MAHACVREYEGRGEPALLVLRAGSVAVRVRRPGGDEVTVGEVDVTIAEVAIHGASGLTLGVGATPGRLERRAVAAAVLDAACASPVAGPRRACEDPAFLTVALDGQEASGVVDHLKLPHHVRFGSELDRLRRTRGVP
jgi:alpha-D-ribose 1-methylphosphonate 5-triphosphate synthase subunit PhnI